MSKTKKLEQLKQGMTRRRQEPQPDRLGPLRRRGRPRRYETVTASLFPPELEALNQLTDTLRKQDPNFTRSHVLRQAILRLKHQLVDKSAGEVHDAFKKWEAEAEVERHK
jgi:hypothetical protein